MHIVNSAVVCLKFPPRKAGILPPQTEDACLCQTINWNVAAIFRDSVVVVAVVVVRTRPRALAMIAMITMRKIIDGFPFLSHMSMGLRSAAFRAAGAPLKTPSD